MSYMSCHMFDGYGLRTMNINMYHSVPKYRERLFIHIRLKWLLYLGTGWYEIPGTPDTSGSFHMFAGFEQIAIYLVFPVDERAIRAARELHIL